MNDAEREELTRHMTNMLRGQHFLSERFEGRHYANFPSMDEMRAARAYLDRVQESPEAIAAIESACSNFWESLGLADANK